MAKALEIPVVHAKFLRRLFEASQRYVRTELPFAEGRAQARLSTEDEVLAELLDALETRSIEPDINVQLMLADLVNAVDHDNEFKRVVAEHEALMDLLKQTAEEKCP